MTTKELIAKLTEIDPEGDREVLGATGGKVKFGPIRTEKIHSAFARNDGAPIILLAN